MTYSPDKWYTLLTTQKAVPQQGCTDLGIISTQFPNECRRSEEANLIQSINTTTAPTSSIPIQGCDCPKGLQPVPSSYITIPTHRGQPREAPKLLTQSLQTQHKCVRASDSTIDGGTTHEVDDRLQCHPIFPPLTHTHSTTLAGRRECLAQQGCQTRSLGTRPHWWTSHMLPQDGHLCQEER